MAYPISHSMADAYMSCQKKFEYAHVKKLMPIMTPEALARGIWGHKVMEVFFLALKEGDTTEHAKEVAMLNAMDNPRYFTKLWDRIAYFIDEILPKMGWTEILDVERTHRIPIGGDYEFPFTVDLVVRDDQGATLAIDFKFGADAYSDELVSLYPQLPKYYGGLGLLFAQGALDYAPNRAMYVFIRSRDSIKNPELFVSVVPVPVTQSRIRESFREQDIASRAILAHLADDARPYPRSFNNNCKYCPFLELCVKEINGDYEASETTEAVLYTKNTYGYGVEEIA